MRYTSCKKWHSEIRYHILVKSGPKTRISFKACCQFFVPNMLFCSCHNAQILQCDKFLKKEIAGTRRRDIAAGAYNAAIIPNVEQRYK